MTTVMTYNSLVNDMRNYAQRGTPSDERYLNQIPQLIMKAEFRLAQACKTLITRPPITGNFIRNNNIVAKPSYTRNTVSWNVGTGASFNVRRPLFQRPYEYVRLYWQDDGESCEPKFYADYDIEHWIVAPTPDLPYPFEVVVDQRIPPLGPAEQTNFFTETVPNLLLDACMLEADIFLQNWDRIPIRRESYDTSLAGVMGEQARRTTDKTQNAKV